VTANQLPPTPFPIVIDLERMEVINANGSDWTVQRAVGGTTATIHSTTFPDNTSKNVMSTPLPLDQNANLMRVCVVSMHYDVVTPGDPAGDCSSLTNPNAPNPPPACVRVNTMQFDEGDSWSADN